MGCLVFKPTDAGFKAPGASADLVGTSQGSSFCSSVCKPKECVTHLVIRARFGICLRFVLVQTPSFLLLSASVSKRLGIQDLAAQEHTYCLPDSHLEAVLLQACRSIAPSAGQISQD